MEMKRGLHWILDIGNTRTKLAAFQDGELTEVWVNEEAEHIANAAIEALALPSRMLIAASGMTPDFWSDWNARWNQTHPHPEALIYLTSAMKLGFDVHYESMETVGLDRLANAAAVIHIDATAIGWWLTWEHASQWTLSRTNPSSEVPSLRGLTCVCARCMPARIPSPIQKIGASSEMTESPCTLETTPSLVFLLDPLVESTLKFMDESLRLRNIGLRSALR